MNADIVAKIIDGRFFINKKNAPYIISVILLVGNIGDMIFLFPGVRSVLINTTNIAVILATCYLYHLKRLSLKNTTLVLIYSLLVNCSISMWTTPTHNPNYAAWFMRLSVIFGLSNVVLAALVSRKSLILSSLSFVVFYLTTIVISGNEYLIKDGFMILFLSLISIGLIVFISRYLELEKKTLLELNVKLLKTSKDMRDYQSQLLHQKDKLQEFANLMQSENENKDKLYSIISHDLINPVGTMAGLSDVLRKRAENSSDQKLRTYAEAIQITAGRTNDLLVNLLYWTRVQSGKMQPHIVEIDMLMEIEAVVELTCFMASQKNIQLIIETGIHSTVFADRNMVSTIARNLITNAIKFTPKGGKVSITMAEDASHISFTVTDTGVGMTPEQYAALSGNTPIVQSSQGTDKEKGTGLGMKLCYEFVNYHGGTISVKSQPMKGTSITVSFLKPESGGVEHNRLLQSQAMTS